MFFSYDEPISYVSRVGSITFSNVVCRFGPFDFIELMIINQIMNEIYKRKVLFCGQTCIESFRTTRVSPQLKTLPTQNSFYCATAKNSGPIALLYDILKTKTTLKLKENYNNSIIFFNCKGDLLRLIPFQIKQRIILFNFTQDEKLLICYAKGNSFVIDPATGKVDEKILISEDEIKINSAKTRLYGAQLVGEKILILRERQLGIVEKLGALWKPISCIKLYQENPIFNGYQKQNGQLQIIYLSSATSIDTLNYAAWTANSTPSSPLYSDPTLKNNAAKLVCIARNTQYIGLIFTDKAILNRIGSGTMLFPFNEFKVQKQDSLCRSQTKSKYRNFHQIGFIDDCMLFYDKYRLLFLSATEPKYQLRTLSNTNLISITKSTLRLIDEHIFIFRTIKNPIYLSVADREDMAQRFLKSCVKETVEKYTLFKQFSEIYDNFIDKKPIEIQKLKLLSKQAEQIWQQIIEVAKLYIDPGEQLRALKFANFLQTFFQIDQRQKLIDSISKQLRVINNLRHQQLNRLITYHQFTDLKSSDQFLLLLLRYNMHYVADRIYQQSISKEKIFLHWARCKIQKQAQSTALEQIKSRYQQMIVSLGNTHVFTELARYCLDNRERNLSNLALMLIQLEPNHARRAVVFLFIFLAKKQTETVDKLLEYVQKSNSTSVIHQSLQSLRQASQDWLPSKIWIQLLPKKPVLEYHYLKILQTNNELQQLRDYYTSNKLFVEMSYASLKKQLQKPQNASLQAASTLIAKDYSKILTSLSENLSKCSQRLQVETLRQLKEKKYPITEDDSNLIALDSSFEVLAEIIIRKDNNLPLAARILRKIKSDKVYSLLLRKGKIKDAIQQAFTRKNKQKMLQLIPRADQQLQNIAKQLYQELLLVK